MGKERREGHALLLTHGGDSAAADYSAGEGEEAKSSSILKEEREQDWKDRLQAEEERRRERNLMYPLLGPAGENDNKPRYVTCETCQQQTSTYTTNYDFCQALRSKKLTGFADADWDDRAEANAFSEAERTIGTRFNANLS